MSSSTGNYAANTEASCLTISSSLLLKDKEISPEFHYPRFLALLEATCWMLTLRPDMINRNLTDVNYDPYPNGPPQPDPNWGFTPADLAARAAFEKDYSIWLNYNIAIRAVVKAIYDALPDSDKDLMAPTGNLSGYSIHSAFLFLGTQYGTPSSAQIATLRNKLELPMSADRTLREHVAFYKKIDASLTFYQNGIPDAYLCEKFSASLDATVFGETINHYIRQNAGYSLPFDHFASFLINYYEMAQASFIGTHTAAAHAATKTKTETPHSLLTKIAAEITTLSAKVAKMEKRGKPKPPTAGGDSTTASKTFQCDHHGANKSHGSSGCYVLHPELKPVKDKST
jgi:hypothetical protein